ncbi:50S ribosomal protein L9 [Slackia faecicanis]|uniref:Large ribosomal subunit protein bL9 n=1 Tax=Slackia faecicanis TaxID=255723 RepID=A0A3N0ADK2_9ACTN|nr:50S ribosomal protein L9 [Slackia faecicanis]MDO5358029.1 50S ribosomal protein L9 [Slackia faecicanis]RNL18665.1 50S ribosomal protein L9 [Slackia faecicanis]
MKVILLTELKGKGGEGDVVEVARGFFNNYLGPQKMAVLATKGNLKQLEQRKDNIAKREEQRIADANALKAALEGKKILVEVKVGEEGVLFGSVTAAMIADAVKAELGIEIDRKRLEVKKAIKTAGEHVVALSIYRDIKVDLNLIVGEAIAEEAAEEVVEEVETAEEAVEATEEAAE